MRRDIAIMLGAALVAISLGGHPQSTHYLRESIESWPEPRKARAIPILNQCRAAADVFVSLWSRGDTFEIYALTGRELREHSSFEDFAKTIDAMHDAYGRVTASEYRNQSLMLDRGDTPELLQDPHVQVVYAVETTKPGKSGVFLEVNLSPEGGLCRVVGVRYQQYFTAIPPWLRKQPKANAEA